MYLNSVAKCIFKEAKAFNSEFSKTKDYNEKMQKDTNNAHLDRQKILQDNKNKLKNKWQ